MDSGLTLVGDVAPMGRCIAEALLLPFGRCDPVPGEFLLSVDDGSDRSRVDTGQQVLVALVLVELVRHRGEVHLAQSRFDDVANHIDVGTRFMS